MYELKKMERYSQVNLLGPAFVFWKKNLPGLANICGASVYKFTSLSGAYNFDVDRLSVKRCAPLV